MLTITLLVSIALAQVTLPNGHPNVQQALLQGTKLPAGHPAVNGLVKTFTGHPNIDMMLQSGAKLPAGHPNVDSQFNYYKSETVVAPVTTAVVAPVPTAQAPVVVAPTNPAPAPVVTTNPVPAATTAVPVVITTSIKPTTTQAAPIAISSTYAVSAPPSCPAPTESSPMPTDAIPNQYPGVIYEATLTGSTATATSTIGLYSSASTASSAIWVILLAML